MESIVSKLSSNLSKMWNKILNLEKTLFPALKEELRLEELSFKEQKLIKILDFAQIENNITVDIIREYSYKLGHHPIIDINPKNSQKLRDRNRGLVRNIFVVKRRKDSSPEPRHGKHIKYVALRSGIECFTSLRYAKHSTPDPDFLYRFNKRL